MQSSLQEGTSVAGGKHVVPPGVAVEELDGGTKKLASKCPQDLTKLLAEKNLKATYDKLVQAVVDESHTRNVFGKWKDKEFDSIIDLHREEFTEKGVRVALCKRRSGGGTVRWLEFIDVDQAPDYVPQYDVSNYSGQVIKTCYATLEFPNGVAVEELKQWKGRNRLKEKIPPYVEKMMLDHDLMQQYNNLVDRVITGGCGANSKMWKIEKLQQIIKEYSPLFEQKGVALFLSHKQEYISHGQYGGHVEYFRWIEFVDRKEQPNYHPQRDAETKKQAGCVIS